MERIRRIIISLNESQPVFGPIYENYGYGQRLEYTSSFGSTSSGLSSPGPTSYDPWAFNSNNNNVTEKSSNTSEWFMGQREFISYHRKLEDNRFPYPQHANGSKPWKELLDERTEFSSDMSLDMEVKGITSGKAQMDFQQFTPERFSTPVSEVLSLVNNLNQCSIGNQMDVDGNVPMKQKIKNKKVDKRQTKTKKQRTEKDLLDSEQPICDYCKSIGQVKAVYRSHTLVDKKGRCLCPALRVQECCLCGSDGDQAHVVEDCPVVRNNGSNFQFLNGPAVMHQSAVRRLNFQKF